MAEQLAQPQAGFHPMTTAAEIEFWRTVQAQATPDAYRAYVEQYPNGAFIRLARLHIRGGHETLATLITRAVCNLSGVSTTEILSERRSRRIARARQVAMVLLIENTMMSIPQIGRFFGHRDHSTVIHARKKIADLCASGEEPETVELLNRAREKVKAHADAAAA
jgi:hypothetical protein